MDPATYAFLVAYKWWLEQDVYYLGLLQGAPNALDNRLLDQILRSYGANLSVPSDHRNRFVEFIQVIQQDEQIGITERARIIIEELNAFELNSVSAATKVNWFVWPNGWTMFDKRACISVIGHAQGNPAPRMLEFYNSLSNRGISELFGAIRDVLVPYGFHPLLAERTVDKFLWLGQPLAHPGEQIARHEAFRDALPTELSENVTLVGEQISVLLADSALMHHQ
ncbi:MAG: hypothetical protein IM650_13120 [Phenylobacterium sp.]|uniref:hypothetical protein n=1 Tax=Phenylobacterium sp. TaxID=1871053 RepID=UPI0025D55F45|nr:hypothetical protein [Phenylobacterium sp.]MCA6259022.1 hypothetical protein [Phenylobacterium sp.]